MREVNKINLEKFRKSNITLEIQSLIPEKIINLAWQSGIEIKNIERKNITTLKLTINLNDYKKLEKIAKKAQCKFKIVERAGLGFLILKLRRRRALILGCILFVIIIYYLSTYIWRIDITTEKNLSPYEIRMELLNYGVKEGVKKKNIDIYKLEEEIMKNNDSIMWIRIRTEGSLLKITASERQSPPKVILMDDPCNLVAKKDGEVVRVYTTAGTALVKEDDIVKKGDILVKGQQGKEGEEYSVHAKGHVIARTFYEEIEEVKPYKIERTKTGNKINNVFINFRGKKLFLKKTVNKFQQYDKIEDNKGPIVIETYYEVKENKVNLDKDSLVNTVAKELEKKITLNFDKNVIVKDKIIDKKDYEEYIEVRLLIVAEENIAVEGEIEEDIVTEPKEN